MTTEKSGREFTTAEVSEMTGISVNVLRQRIDQGWLTPRAEGKKNGRRYFWTERDIAQAKALVNDQESGKSAAEALVDSLGLSEPEFKVNLARGREMLERCSADQVVAVGTGAARIVQTASLVREAVRGAGGDVVVILV